MTIAITEPTPGTIAIAGRVDAKHDVRVETDLSVTGNVAVSGSVFVEDVLTETDSPAVMRKFALVIPNVPLDSGAHCYIVAPCDANIVSIYAVVSAVTAAVVGDPMALTLSINGSPMSPTLAVGDETNVLGDVFSHTFVSPGDANKGNPLLVESNGTGDSGAVDVTLICEQQ